ncbi:F10B6.31 [Arabidopsis thaliana]|uniref:HMG-Y-related protein A n=3 Tax=Arabidopsis thaliana TaxID=3702 RepID=HMGYA_ARATH|nr:high mobility group A [Arabidopsis thaliana]Q43386.1 RecName: Full=HMG-Y-related protein A; Short=AtHMGA; AltName: Full=High mobility group A protein [Arabidopsis thaliana]AAB97739.1 high mobility group protein a [Arabidopsis thaliana]AAF79232.1 F10B6.31 [Arabidopsis thaliana]AAO44072.1 At1g14900 [Arabidopsis thaliana]AEE29240.1 high mobility group A [Arabidopsis thaliana]CAA67564.1 HMG-I/Y protein [Arabidopsis thaliana]|eukprot:NP_172943.1 high mobility group A [Arabidopsis thaliana]
MAFDLHHGSASDTHSSELPSFSLPPYPQMIMEAIESLNDKNGCNKTTIAKHIESTQQTLPPSHMTLLSYHLNQMKKTGQLIMVKNNYMKPDPDAPPKRGRGRPPKQKTQAESDAAAAAVVAATVVSTDPPRSRGRPPKPKDPSEPPQEKVITGSGRPRGRPPKRPRTDSETVAAPEPAAQATGERRGRGRPPKVKPTVVAPVGC